jgi:peptide/nickel transport system permease protein
MLTYTIRRLIQAIPIMLGISILIFLIVQLAPGDPVDRF